MNMLHTHFQDNISRANEKVPCATEEVRLLQAKLDRHNENTQSKIGFCQKVIAAYERLRWN